MYLHPAVDPLAPLATIIEHHGRALHETLAAPEVADATPAPLAATKKRRELLYRTEHGNGDYLKSGADEIRPYHGNPSA